MNQVTNKNVYVIKTGHAVSAHVLGAENKIYFDQKGFGNDLITTDKIEFGKIKHIRISNPTGEKFKEWHITPPTFGASEEPNIEYLVHMNFEHADGFDRMESKVASLVVTSKMLNSGTTSYTKTFQGVKNADDTTADNVTINSAAEAFAYEMAARIAAQFVKGTNPFTIYVGENLLSATGDGTTVAFTISREVESGETEVVKVDGTTLSTGYSISGTTITFTSAPAAGKSVSVSIENNKIILKENPLYPTISRMERRIYPFSQKMFITTNRVKGETESWCPEVAAASVQQPSGRYGRYYGEATAWKSLKNGYLVWLMERNTFLDHNEMIYPDLCDGYAAGDMITDGSDMETETSGSGTQYYILDIAYWTQPKDVVAKSNLKEMTFCSATLEDLTTIAANIGTITSTPSTLALDAVAVYKPKTTA